jgi:hypothetical protein
MNAAFIIFFACFGACMANDGRLAIFDSLIQQAQQIGITILNIASQEIMALAQQVAQQMQTIAAAIGGRFNFDIMAFIKPLLDNLLAQGMQLLSSFNLASILGRAKFDFGQIFSDFYNQIAPAITGLGQHFLNQGLSAVLGAIGGIGGRGFGDLFAGIGAQFSNLLNGAQSALSGVVSNISNIATQVLDASKPHWESLQEQLIGHGLNVLNSLGNTINDLHGTITSGGR